jgi:hypothetical protein
LVGNVGKDAEHIDMAQKMRSGVFFRTVIFWYKDTQTDEKIVMHCSALDFISYMVRAGKIFCNCLSI